MMSDACRRRPVHFKLPRDYFAWTEAEQSAWAQRQGAELATQLRAAMDDTEAGRDDDRG